MKHSFFLTAITAVLLIGCTQSYKKVEGGLEYKIISDGKGKQIAAGNYFEFAMDYSYKGSNKDTLIFNSRDYYNQIVMLDSVQIPANYYKIFSQVRLGDSVVIRQLTDSIMKQPNQAMPFFKKGAYVFTKYKIVNIYTTREAADSANQVQREVARQRDSAKQAAQLVKDAKTIADYLAKNKIQASKAPMGTYVQYLNEGEGNVLDTSVVVKVNYTGRSLDDNKVFDSNIDPQFGHVEPITVYLNAPPGMGVIKGWTDGLLTMKNKQKAVFFIPSSLGYGAQGSGDRIKPNANLVFEVEVVGVMTAEQARAEAEVSRKKMEAQQKAQMDSIRKAQMDTMKR